MCQLKCCCWDHIKSTLAGNIPENMTLTGSPEHHVNHVTHIILLKSCWEFRESPKFWRCEAKWHKEAWKTESKMLLYYWKSCLRIAVDSPRTRQRCTAGHSSPGHLKASGACPGPYCLVYCRSEGKPVLKFSDRKISKRKKMVLSYEWIPHFVSIR